MRNVSSIRSLSHHGSQVALVIMVLDASAPCGDQSRPTHRNRQPHRIRIGGTAGNDLSWWSAVVKEERKAFSAARQNILYLWPAATSVRHSAVSGCSCRSHTSGHGRVAAAQRSHQLDSLHLSHTPLSITNTPSSHNDIHRPQDCW